MKCTETKRDRNRESIDACYNNLLSKLNTPGSSTSLARCSMRHIRTKQNKHLIGVDNTLHHSHDIFELCSSSPSRMTLRMVVIEAKPPLSCLMLEICVAVPHVSNVHSGLGVRVDLLPIQLIHRNWLGSACHIYLQLSTSPQNTNSYRQVDWMVIHVHIYVVDTNNFAATRIQLSLPGSDLAGRFVSFTPFVLPGIISCFPPMVFLRFVGLVFTPQPLGYLLSVLFQTAPKTKSFVNLTCVRPSDSFPNVPRWCWRQVVPRIRHEVHAVPP